MSRVKIDILFIKKERSSFFKRLNLQYGCNRRIWRCLFRNENVIIYLKFGVVNEKKNCVFRREMYGMYFFIDIDIGVWFFLNIMN